MTLIVGCISCALAIVLSAFTADIAEFASRRARAQTAADASALAAAAESAPYGRGSPEAEADRFAALNGAEVLRCLCDPGSTAMQVTVSIDGIEASARAVIDPKALAPADVLGPAGLHPKLQRAVEVLLTEAGGAVQVISGYRSSQEQAALWTSALRRYGSAEAADDWVAPPGHSMHERGLAIDLGGDVELAARLATELNLPLHRPLPNEPWHFELVGSG